MESASENKVITSCGVCREVFHRTGALRVIGVECEGCHHTFTCDECKVKDCEFRDDLYNTDGDCLLEK